MSGALFVKRWTMYGKDRLYVQTTAGEKVGWLDFATGATTLDPNTSTHTRESVTPTSGTKSRTTSTRHGSTSRPEPSASTSRNHLFVWCPCCMA